MEKMVLDLNEIATGKVELHSFKAKLDQLDLTPYKNKHVQLAGCAPTWAHLLVAGKLFSHVAALDFLLDDGKEGREIEILRS